MPSEKILKEKQQTVQNLVDKLKAAKSIVLVDYKGINVENDTKLRAEMRAEGVYYGVIKNSLLTFAFKDAGLEEVLPSLAGSTAVALSDDEVAPARVLNKYTTKSKDIFNFKSGYVAGKFMDADALKAIASLPSREGLVAQLAGTMNSIIASLARGLSEVAKQKEEAA